MAYAGPAWHGARDLIAELLSSEMPEGLRSELLDLAARFGHDASWTPGAAVNGR